MEKIVLNAQMGNTQGAVVAGRKCRFPPLLMEKGGELRVS